MDIIPSVSSASWQFLCDRWLSASAVVSCIRIFLCDRWLQWGSVVLTLRTRIVWYWHYLPCSLYQTCLVHDTGWVLTTQNSPVYCAQSSTSHHFWLTQYSKCRTLSYRTTNILHGDCSLGREKIFKKGALLPPQQAGQHSFTMAMFQVKTLNLVALIKVSWGVFLKSAWVPVTCMLPHHSFSSTRFWSIFSLLLHLPYRKGRSSRLVLAMASSMGCGKSQLSISLTQWFTYVLLSHNTYCSVLLVLFQAHFGLSSCEKWKQHDGIFHYADFYYRIMNFLMFKADNKWCKALYSYLNK